MNPALAIGLNVLALYGVAIILTAAFAVQLVLAELPCPLCLLQRIQFAALAIGPILNVRFGPRPMHYALSLIAAVLGAAVAMRHMFLHILPGDTGYGSAVLGYHFYTWAFALFAAAIVLIALVLLFDRQFATSPMPRRAGSVAAAAVYLVIVMTGLNVASTLLQCGFGACADDPVVYELLKPRP